MHALCTSPSPTCLTTAPKVVLGTAVTMSVAVDGLDLVLFNVIHKIWRWSQVVFSVFPCFDIWGKQGCVEYCQGYSGPLSILSMGRFD